MIYFLLFTLILYLAGALVEATLNLPKWEKDTRHGVAVVWVMGFIVTLIVTLRH